uniref:Rho GTPase activating protein 33 n=1 Tax=Naja naja TaxID=35670 RepID=A0A8C6XWM9_NAJNA
MQLHNHSGYVLLAGPVISNDIISVIDMPPKEDRSWWRGKHGFQVGFFPSECVELFSERPSPGVKPGECLLVLWTSLQQKHGKLIGFLRTFMKSRPSKQRLKQRGILRERVFGCDLGEHLKNSGSDVPQVLRSCSDFIEKHGVVDGIYRLSGVSSNIQRLRHEFDSERVPELSKDVYLQDIHSVSSLCKLYFRELPNPLLTYQLYNKFADAVSVSGNEERLVRVHDVIQQLPPPHYRTLEFLLRHLARMAMHSQNTSMHIRNLAIVWAPNLLRSMALESVAQCGANAFQEVRVQSLVVEFLLTNVQVLFSDTFTSIGKDSTGRCFLSRPKSQLVSCPSTRLLSLEEAQARTQALCKITKLEARRGSPDPQDQGKLSAVLGSPNTRLENFNPCHFFLVGSWPLGLPKLPSLRRPHSSSDAFPTLKQCHSCSSLGSSVSGHGEGLATGADDAASRRRSSWLEGDSELDSELELSPPGLRGLDFDPLTYQCSPPVPQPSLSDDSSSASPVAALSPCSHPNVSQDASETSVSLPDKVLEMFSGGESRGLSSAPHMISMLLNMAGGQLSNTCERESLRCSLSFPNSGPKSEAAPVSPGALSLLRHIPPPPPPKNPARLMALALAESAHQAALQQKRQASLKQREPRTHFRRSLSLECKAGELTSGAQALYSMVRPSPKVPGLSPLQAQVRGRSIGSQSRNLKGGSQVRDQLTKGWDRAGITLPLGRPCLTDHPLRPHSHFPASSRPESMGAPSQLEHENLYYEIVGEPPAYPGLARPWPSCPPPEYLATFNASYGVFERPWRQAHLPPAASSLQPILKNSQLQIQSMPPAVTRQEPIYVNVPFPEPSLVSPTPSPPPEAAHPRSHSDPGAPQALPQPSRPPLPQKQNRAVWQFYRPPSACWGHPSYGPEPIITYDGPTSRLGSQASTVLCSTLGKNAGFGRERERAVNNYPKPLFLFCSSIQTKIVLTCNKRPF